MGLEERIRGALVTSAKSFHHALDLYEPTSEVNPYPERMVSYFYIQAIANALAPASVLLEIPVTGKHGREKDNHVDALVFNDSEVVVAEFKRAWTPSHWGNLARDFARLRGPVALEICRRFKGDRRRQPFILLGADCWRREVANAWKSGSRAKPWTLPSTFQKAHRDTFCVYRWDGADYDGYYFTWAILPFDEMPA